MLRNTENQRDIELTRSNTSKSKTFRLRRSSSVTKTVFVTDEDLRGLNVLPFGSIATCKLNISLVLEIMSYCMVSSWSGC